MAVKLGVLVDCGGYSVPVGSCTASNPVLLLGYAIEPLTANSKTTTEMLTAAARLN